MNAGSYECIWTLGRPLSNVKCTFAKCIWRSASKLFSATFTQNITWVVLKVCWSPDSMNVYWLLEAIPTTLPGSGPRRWARSYVELWWFFDSSWIFKMDWKIRGIILHLNLACANLRSKGINELFTAWGALYKRIKGIDKASDKARLSKLIQLC